MTDSTTVHEQVGKPLREVRNAIANHREALEGFAGIMERATTTQTKLQIVGIALTIAIAAHAVVELVALIRNW